jgi:thiol:disulfide interchange protein DsbD
MAAVVLDVKEGLHAQSRTPTQEYLIKFDARPDENPAVTFGQVIYPPGKEETYPQLGKLSVYTGRVVVYIPFEVKPDAKAGELKLTGRLTYQICDDQSCYPPERPKFTIETKVAAPGEDVKPAEPELFRNAPKPGESRAAVEAPTTSPTTSPSTAPAVNAPSGPDVSSGGLEGSNWSFGYAMGAAFIAGLLFNIMPCVLPVLPLKAAGFYEAAGHSRARSIVLGLVFGAGIISVFAALALLVLVFRTITWGELFSKGWFIWSIVILLTAMAFGLFGTYTFRLPMGAYTFEPRHDTFSCCWRRRRISRRGD